MAPITDVSVGLATKLGVSSSAVLGLIALASAVVGGDHSTETVGALAIAGWTIGVTVFGRMFQAAHARK